MVSIFYAFVIGFLIDLFSGNLGMHSTACLLIALLKDPVSKITIPHNIIEENDELTIQKKLVKKSFLVIFCDFNIYTSPNTIYS